ncbi:MAG: NAD(P)/FAD-dependent oxidoreductase [Gemmatimonadota bacterium]|nr:NAD(P)/FAD-dependent oxidoreductase [Gemmatimonadota bacterium]
MNSHAPYDVAIVGGGPAGLTAAVWLARHLRSVVVIDSGDPRNWETRGVHGYLGLPDITPAELRGRGREEARALDAELLDGTVERIARIGDDLFRLTVIDIGNPGRPGQRPPELQGQRTVELDSRRVLLAIGIKDIWPDVPGLDRCYGDTVHHCPSCDGYEVRDCKTVVIANGRRAVGMALDLATWTRDLVICTHGEAPDFEGALGAKLRALDIPVVSERIVRVVSRESRVVGLELEGGRVLDCQRIFFSIGKYPSDDLGVQLHCRRDEEGFIITDERYHTSVPNVFAAGDIIAGPYLALRAAADGAVAGMAIHRSLLPPELTLD